MLNIELLAAAGADKQLNRVVIALFVLAGVIAVTTVIYWRLTKPERQAKEPSAGND